MKDYYINIAKIFTADNFITPKLRDEQKSFFFRHGAGGLKNTKGIGRIPSTVDYILGMCEDFKLVNSSKTLLPKVVTLSGIETVVR